MEPRGLCLECYLRLTRATPPMPERNQTLSAQSWVAPEHKYNMAEFARVEQTSEFQEALAQNREESRARHAEREQWRANLIDALLTWPRCEACPPLAGDGSHSRWSLHLESKARLCGDCWKARRVAVKERFPLMDGFEARVESSPEQIQAFWTYHEGAELVAMAGRSMEQKWPMCDACPGIPPTPQKQREKGMDSQILAALAAHESLTAGQLEDLIKPLNKNNRGKVMQGLVDEGLVTVTTLGPAKYFRLA